MRGGRASSSRRSTIRLMRSSSRGTTLWKRSRKRASSNRLATRLMNVRKDVSGFLISWARPAARVPTAASRSERRSWLSSWRTTVRSRRMPTAPRSLPSPPLSGAVDSSTGSPLPLRRRSVSGTLPMGARLASVSIRMSPISGVSPKTSVQ